MVSVQPSQPSQGMVPRVKQIGSIQIKDWSIRSALTEHTARAPEQASRAQGREGDRSPAFQH